MSCTLFITQIDYIQWYTSNKTYTVAIYMLIVYSFLLHICWYYSLTGSDSDIGRKKKKRVVGSDQEDRGVDGMSWVLMGIFKLVISVK